MKPVISSLPRPNNYEYQLTLSPHEDLQQQIAKLKDEFAIKYKLPRVKVAQPHITLVKFLTVSMVEEKLIHRLQAIAMGIAPFKIELKGFGSFPTHTININVSTKVPIQNLVKELRQAQKLMKAYPDHAPHFITEPYIAIAQKLKPWQYEQGWLEYSHKHFTSRFIADGMLLLKRPDNSKPYQLVKRFQFMNLPIATKQGELFV